MPTLRRRPDESASGNIIETELIEMRTQMAEKLKQITQEGARLVGCGSSLHSQTGQSQFHEYLSLFFK